MPSESGGRGSYLLGLLAEATRPFAFRGAVYRLLGTPGPSEVASAYRVPFPEISPEYERPRPELFGAGHSSAPAAPRFKPDLVPNAARLRNIDPLVHEEPPDDSAASDSARPADALSAQIARRRGDGSRTEQRTTLGPDHSGSLAESHTALPEHRRPEEDIPVGWRSERSSGGRTERPLTLRAKQPEPAAPPQIFLLDAAARHGLSLPGRAPASASTRATDISSAPPRDSGPPIQAAGRRDGDAGEVIDAGPPAGPGAWRHVAPRGDTMRRFVPRRASSTYDLERIDPHGASRGGGAPTALRATRMISAEVQQLRYAMESLVARRSQRQEEAREQENKERPAPPSPPRTVVVMRSATPRIHRAPRSLWASSTLRSRHLRPLR